MNKKSLIRLLRYTGFTHGITAFFPCWALYCALTNNGCFVPTPSPSFTIIWYILRHILNFTIRYQTNRFDKKWPLRATNFIGPMYPMPHSKPQGQRPFGSRDFLKVYTIYGCGGHLGHVTKMWRANFCFLYPLRLHNRSGFDWSSGFWEEDVWRVWTMDGWMKESANTISSPYKGSGE